MRCRKSPMDVSDVLYALKDLVLAIFREPALLWQLAPVLLLWIILIFYFATHKEEKLGWNTSLANGISLFWVVVSAMQHIFANGREFFTWIKFGIFAFITLYALFIVYVTFSHKFSAKATYLLASHNVVYYFSLVSLLYAYDVIYLNTAMIIAIVVLFLFILLLELILKKLLPELKEGDSGDSGSYDDFSSSDSSSFSESSYDSPSSSPEPGGIETAMGEKNLSESDISFK